MVKADWCELSNTENIANGCPEVSQTKKKNIIKTGLADSRVN